MSGVNLLERRYTSAVPTALGTPTNVTDDVTTQTTGFTSVSNAVMDVLNDPDPGALRYELRLLLDDVDSGRAFFTQSLNPASAGRTKIYEINPTGLKIHAQARIQWQVIQRAGALTATSFKVSYRNGFGIRG